MILLDTHVLLWLFFEPGRLSPGAVDRIHTARAEGGLAVAAVTLFEVAHLVARKRLVIHTPCDVLLNDIASRFLVKPITASIALASTQLNAPYPRDPMDRLIGATALVEGMPLVTADERIQSSGQVQTIW